MNKPTKPAGIGHNGGPPIGSPRRSGYVARARLQALAQRMQNPRAQEMERAQYIVRENPWWPAHGRGEDQGLGPAVPGRCSTGVRIEGGLRVIDIDVGDGPWSR